MPVIGGITRNFATARISRLLGVLLESNVPLLDALELTETSVSNYHYQKLIADAKEAITQGEMMSDVFDNPSLVTPSVFEAVRHGEQSGKMGAMLLMMADFLDEENDTLIRSLTSILEPVILIFLGSIVAFVAMSIFIPLFDLTASATGGAS
jgi:type II secretory pathway component PulF